MPRIDHLVERRAFVGFCVNVCIRYRWPQVATVVQRAVQCYLIAHTSLNKSTEQPIPYSNQNNNKMKRKKKINKSIVSQFTIKDTNTQSNVRKHSLDLYI